MKMWLPAIVLLYPFSCLAVHPLVSGQNWKSGQASMSAEGLVINDLLFIPRSGSGIQVQYAGQGLRPFSVNSFASSLALKWRFYSTEDSPLSIGEAGRLLDPFASWTGWKRYRMPDAAGTVNPALQGNALHDENGFYRQQWHASAALLLNLKTRTRMLLDVGLRSGPDHLSEISPSYGAAGFLYSINESTDVDIGLKREWHNRHPQTSFGLGLKLRW